MNKSYKYIYFDDDNLIMTTLPLKKNIQQLLNVNKFSGRFCIYPFFFKEQQMKSHEIIMKMVYVAWKL